MTAPVSMAAEVFFALNECIKNRNLFPVPRWNQVNMVIEDNSIILFALIFCMRFFKFVFFRKILNEFIKFGIVFF